MTDHPTVRPDIPRILRTGTIAAVLTVWCAIWFVGLFTVIEVVLL